jgi:N-acetylglucosamine-6-phosphate deacetylase
MSRVRLQGARILSPGGWLDGHLLVLDGPAIAAIEPDTGPSEAGDVTLEGGLLVPGFIDVQVNGGGGVLFNDRPTVDGIAAIAAAHRAFGTTGLLPTLISDELDVIARAIAAVDRAIVQGVPGVLGIHIEGPFLNAAKRGIHDSGTFRTLDDEAIALLTSLRRGVTMVTLAPELAPPGAIAALARRGAIVMAGHSLADHDSLAAAQADGLRGVTHLFNAMTQMEGRAPGMVGATLDRRLYAGAILDGHHVHPASLRVAHRCLGPDRMLLVTDAMPTVGWDGDGFTVGGTQVFARDGALRSADGTLAGSNLDMAAAVRNAVAMLGVPIAEACTMASSTPAALLGLCGAHGALAPGLAADIVHLDADLRVTGSWIAGCPA